VFSPQARVHDGAPGSAATFGAPGVSVALGVVAPLGASEGVGDPAAGLTSAGATGVPPLRQGSQSAARARAAPGSALAAATAISGQASRRIAAARFNGVVRRRPERSARRCRAP